MKILQSAGTVLITQRNPFCRGRFRYGSFIRDGRLLIFYNESYGPPPNAPWRILWYDALGGIAFWNYLSNGGSSYEWTLNAVVQVSRQPISGYPLGTEQGGVFYNKYCRPATYLKY